ncbi:unnamed protein product [Dicrocoelium dendriticum]|nr:unnamed protein product [Dicrocoelium dendriticum]
MTSELRMRLSKASAAFDQPETRMWASYCRGLADVVQIYGAVLSSVRQRNLDNVLEGFQVSGAVSSTLSPIDPAHRLMRQRCRHGIAASQWHVYRGLHTSA